jgi:hypothetical protein
MHTFIHTYIHSCIHACIHTYIHTHTYTHKWNNDKVNEEWRCLEYGYVHLEGGYWLFEGACCLFLSSITRYCSSEVLATILWGAKSSFCLYSHKYFKPHMGFFVVLYLISCKCISSSEKPLLPIISSNRQANVWQATPVIGYCLASTSFMKLRSVI